MGLFSKQQCLCWLVTLGYMYTTTFALSSLVCRASRPAFRRRTLPKRSWSTPRRRTTSSTQPASLDTDIQAFMEHSTQPRAQRDHPSLTRTAVHRMRVPELRRELQRRRLDFTGTRKELVPRLLDDLVSSDQEFHNGPQLDSQKRYILQVKGNSCLQSTGTGVGLVLLNEDDPKDDTAIPVWEVRKYLNGNRSVFESEYSALVLALRYALKWGIRRLEVQLDHDIICAQMEGKFPVEKEVLKAMYWSIMNLKESFDELRFTHISTNENLRATDLARKALATSKSLPVFDDDDSTDPMDGYLSNKKSKRADVMHHTDSHIDIDPSQTYLLQFDGGARGNPAGIAGAGMVIYDQQGKEVWCGWKFLGRVSNNMAEYSALLLGLKCAKSLGIQNLVAEGDSELIIKQLKGIYQVKDAKLKKLFEPTKDALAQFQAIDIRHVFRRDNKRADWLANHAMDTRSSHGFDELDPA